MEFELKRVLTISDERLLANIAKLIENVEDKEMKAMGFSDNDIQSLQILFEAIM